MSLLDTVNAIKDNIGKANSVMEQIAPLHAEFMEMRKSIDGLDMTQSYFGVNEDGTATVLSFDPTPGNSFGAPRFQIALPLPAEAVPAPVPENVAPLETTAQ